MIDAVVHVVARLVPLPGKAADLAAAVEAIIPDVRREPGCLTYAAHESRDEPASL